MVSPDIKRYNSQIEITPRAEKVVDHMCTTFSESNAILKDRIRQKSQHNLLVNDALVDLEFHHDDQILPEGVMRRSLQLAQPLPSDGRINVVPTVIRLLREVSRVPEFQLPEYGKDVVKGITALRRLPDESFAEYMQRLATVTKTDPDLKLAGTQGRIMTLDALKPACTPIPLGEKENTETAYEKMCADYEASFATFFEGTQAGIWIPRIQHAIKIGRAALDKTTK